ncbi:MAG: hypothetical protein H6Q26_1906, partial [Bacteroidetes bacterium]|nr:hypothetical protein [Bacteroidota bacterium]
MKSNAALLLLAGIFGTGLFLTSC